MGRPRKDAVKTQDALLDPQEVPEIPLEEQPYPLPKGWKWVKGHTFLGPQETGKPNGDFFYYIDIDAIDNKNQKVKSPKKIPAAKAPSRASRKLHEGDTIFSLVRPYLRNIAYINPDLCDCIASTGFYICKPSEYIDSRYLFWMMTSDYVVMGLNQYMKGDNSPSIRKDDIENFLFPLPPLREQQRIVHHIESLFAKLDEAKEQAEAVLDGFEPRKAAILHKAFTGELTEKWREANGLTFIDWENLSLNDVAEYRKGPFGSSITKSMFVPKGKDTFKVYEQGNAIQKTLSYGNYYISKEKFNELSSFSVRAGDIIISCAGTIGEIYKLPEGCENGIINQALMRVRVYRNINEKFFEYYFSGVIKRDVIGKANGTAIQNIPPFKVMKAMPICLPPLYEQAEIIRLLDELLSKEQQTKAMAEAVLNQIELMKKTILAKAFHGEL